MSDRTYTRLAALLVVLALASGVTAAIGVFARGSGATAKATSIRGEEFEYATDGIYAYNPERVVAEGVGWDAVTLVFAAPALLLTAIGVRRGSLGARLAAVGILAYVFYQYVMYAVFWALGPLFPVFIVLYATAIAGIVWTVSTIDVAGLSDRLGDRFPRRGMVVFSILVGLLLVGMWSQRIATGLAGDLAGAGLLGTPTLTVQALDLGMIVPLAVATAGLLVKRHRWGYLLAPVLAVKGVTMAGAICAMLISAALVEGSLEVVPFVVFGAATVASGWLAVKMLRGVSPETARV